MLAILKNRGGQFSIAALLMTASTMASAALPPSVSTAFSDLLADVQAMVDLAWTVVVPVTIAFIILGMFKRAAYSAT